MLQVNSISKKFGNQIVLNNINLSVNNGEIIALLGESGSGKTTLLRIIAGLELSNDGSILLNDTILSDKKLFLKPEKRNVGVVFQDYALFPHLSVEKNITFALKNKENLDYYLEIFELIEHRNKKPSALSGGQQQRVAIARSLIVNPSLLLLDEPFSCLDQSLRRAVRTKIANILKKERITSILVTHDPNDAMQIADKIAVLQKGEIIQYDTPEMLYKNPSNAYVGNLTGVINEYKGALVRPEKLKFEPSEKGEYNIINSVWQNGKYLIQLKSVESRIFLLSDSAVKIGDTGNVLVIS